MCGWGVDRAEGRASNALPEPSGIIYREERERSPRGTTA